MYCLWDGRKYFCFSGDDSDDRFCNFPYRKLFTPDLNVFPYTKVSISIVTIVTTSFRRILSTDITPWLSVWCNYCCPLKVEIHFLNLRSASCCYFSAIHFTIFKLSFSLSKCIICNACLYRFRCGSDIRSICFSDGLWSGEATIYNFHIKENI